MSDKNLVASSTHLPTNLTIHEVLDQIRPAWKGKSLIQRVLKILPVDPSSACQRLFNAAIHDLRDKVVIAGIDIAKESATNNKLPSINKEEDIEEYPTSKLIDLCYRMGLLTRPEWRRLHRSYEIRRDLEHEDDEYEAALEDCMYIFKTSIDIVLSKDPVELLRVKDIKEIVEEPTKLIPSLELLENYERAPQTRQKEICLFLISVSLDTEKPDIVRENSFVFLSHLEQLTQSSVKIELAEYLQQRMGRKGIDILHARVANACGAMSYFKKARILDFYKAIFINLQRIGTHWKNHTVHGDALGDFEDIGGLTLCPDELLKDIIKWFVLTYIGEPGEQGYYGRNRKVFYSNSAAPIISRLIKTGPTKKIMKILKELSNDKEVKSAISNIYVARRFEDLLDLLFTDED